MRTFILKSVLVCASFFASSFAFSASGVDPANHSLSVVGTPTVSGSTVSFVGSPTQASALNLLFTGQVCYNSAVYNGSTFTFTSVGQQNTFSVTLPSGALPVGATSNLTISITDGSTTSCNNGNEGFSSSFAVYVPAPPVPALDGVSLALLAAMLAVAGLLFRRRVL